MPIRPDSVPLEPGQARRLGVDLFNYVWTLLEREDRSERESALMVHAAHASRFFWEEPGDAVNHARGEWQISRVYATLERAEPAIHHARECLNICEDNGIGDFDIAYAYEALARAYAVAGDAKSAKEFEGKARDAAGGVADKDDKDKLLADLETLPGKADGV
jgi:hypothetical protein